MNIFRKAVGIAAAALLASSASFAYAQDVTKATSGSTSTSGSASGAIAGVDGTFGNSGSSSSVGNTTSKSTNNTNVGVDLGVGVGVDNSGSGNSQNTTNTTNNLAQGLDNSGSGNSTNKNKQGQDQGQQQSASNQGVSNNTSFSETNISKQKLQAPGITMLTGNTTAPCKTAWSAGGSGPGFSIGAGGATKDEGCEMRARAEMLFNFGMHNTSISYLCLKDAELKKVIEAEFGDCRPFKEAAASMPPVAPLPPVAAPPAPPVSMAPIPNPDQAEKTGERGAAATTIKKDPAAAQVASADVPQLRGMIKN